MPFLGMANAESLKALQQFNIEIRRITKDIEGELVYGVAEVDARETDQLVNSIKGSVGYSYGEAERLRFKFARHGVFVEKGVGRGWPISRVKSGTALLQGNNGKARFAKPWFNPVLDRNLDRVADAAVEYFGDLGLANINFKKAKIR